LTPNTSGELIGREKPTPEKRKKAGVWTSGFRLDTAEAAAMPDERADMLPMARLPVLPIKFKKIISE
jgi:hypothetical protein